MRQGVFFFLAAVLHFFAQLDKGIVEQFFFLDYQTLPRFLKAESPALLTVFERLADHGRLPGGVFCRDGDAFAELFWQASARIGR